MSCPHRPVVPGPFYGSSVSSSAPPPACERGFTLIELMVAVTLLAVLLVMVFSATSSALRSFDRLTDGTGRQTQLASALSIINDDFYNLVPRPVRTGQNTHRESFRMRGSEELFFVEFTRGGLPVYDIPPTQLKRMNLASPQTGMARVAYRFTEEGLYRYEWGVLDAEHFPEEETEMHRTLILEKVDDIQILSYSRDKDGALRAETVWPPVKSDKRKAMKELPKAVSLLIRLQDMGEIELFYATS